MNWFTHLIKEHCIAVFLLPVFLLFLFCGYASAQDDSSDIGQGIIDALAGEWLVKIDASEPASGWLNVDSQLGLARLTLQEGDNVSRYDLHSTEGRDETGSVVKALFKRRSENERERAAVSSRAVPIRTNRDSIEFVTVLGQSAQERNLTLPIVRHDRSGDTLLFDLKGEISSGNLKGQALQGSDANGQTASWIRNTTEIDGVIVVEFQMSPEFAFPFDEIGNAIAGRVPTRRLLVIGQKLGDGEHIWVPSSQDSGLSYGEPNSEAEVLAEARLVAKTNLERQLMLISSTPEPQDLLRKRIQSLIEKLESAEYLLIDVELNQEAQPGQKKIRINGKAFAWPLVFHTSDATLGFVRPADRYGSEPTAVFFHGDQAVAEIGIRGDTALREIPLQFIVTRQSGKSESAGVVVASLVDEHTDLGQSERIATYRSETIDLIPSGSTTTPSRDSESVVVSVNPGDVLRLQLYDPVMLRTRPLNAQASIEDNPGTLGELWADALARAAACNGGNAETDSLFALRAAKRFSRYAVGEALMYTASFVSPLGQLAISRAGQDGRIRFEPSVSVLNGDHAAALLIRDAIIQQLSDPEITLFYAALANNRNQEIQHMRQAARAGRTANFPIIENYSGKWFSTPTAESWSAAVEGTGTYPVLIDIPLRETLNIKKLAAKLGTTAPKARAWAVEQTRLAALRQTTVLSQAIGRASDVKDCDLEQLLVIAGQMADAAVVDIIPRLVKQSGGIWVADNLARGFVRRLHYVGAAMKALNEYENLDDAYKAMAFAAATAGLGAAASGELGVFATYGMLAADGLDAAYFGRRDLLNYLDAEATYTYLAGGVSLFGQDAVREAEDTRENAVLASLGLVAPGFSVISNLSELRRARNIQNGSAIFAKGKLNSLDDLENLSQEENVAVAAFLNNTLEIASRTGEDALDNKQLQGFEFLRKVWKKNREEGFRGTFTEVIHTPIPMTMTGVNGSPYSKPLFPQFSPSKSYNGTIHGAQIYGDDGTILIRGEQLNTSGAFTEVFSDILAPDEWVIKRRGVVLAGENDPAKRLQVAKQTENLVHDTETGYALLHALEPEAKFFRTAERSGTSIWAQDPNNPDVAAFFVREENLTDYVGNIPVRGALERFQARQAVEGKGANELEAVTINLAMRELNQKGIFWTDKKLSNLDVVPDRDSPTGYKVVFFDYDGFRPAKGIHPDGRDLEQKLWLQAREAQIGTDSYVSRSQDHLVTELIGTSVDQRIFGRQMHQVTSAGQGKHTQKYVELNNLEPGEFAKEISRINTAYGLQVPYSPPGF